MHGILNCSCVGSNKKASEPRGKRRTSPQRLNRGGKVSSHPQCWLHSFAQQGCRRAHLKNPKCTKTLGGRASDPTGRAQRPRPPTSQVVGLPPPPPRTLARQGFTASSSPCPAMLIQFRRPYCDTRQPIANYGRMVRDSAIVTMHSLLPTYRSLNRVVRSMTPYDLFFPQMGSIASFVICRILNGHISATGHPIHFMFGSMAEFSGSDGRWIEWRYFRFHQIQGDGQSMV